LKFIKLDRIRWAGHMMRMEQSDPTRKVLCTKPGVTGDRKRGRPKFRWCDELQEGVAWVGCRNWRINVQSREQLGVTAAAAAAAAKEWWWKLIEEVKFDPGI
jgi:hypothetical protein